MMSARVWTSTHLKLQHGFVRNLNGDQILVTIERSEEMGSSKTVYLNGCLHIMGYSGFYP